MRKPFPHPRVEADRALVPAAARVTVPWTGVDLVVELPAVTWPTCSLSRRTRREVMAAAGGSRSGRGSP